MRSALCLVTFVLCAVIAVVSCQKELSIDLLDATASLKDSSGNCLPAVVHGSYQADSAFTADNYIDLQVNVSTPGSYFVQTKTVNGFYFRVQGQFENPGLQTIRLKAFDKPLAAGSFTFDINYGGSSCPIVVDVTNGVAGGAYTLTNAAGECSVMEVKGVYMQGVATDSSNYMGFDVHVTNPGSYNIHTETTNGISFLGSGIFADTGMQHVILKAAGTPVAAGDYTIQFADDNSNCSFSLTVKPESNDPAAYTINCTSTQLNGDYSAGLAMTSANTATIYATVIAAGKYNISTNTVNGISFSASGTFTSPSATAIPVVLKAAGTAVARGNFDYTITANNNNCDFQVPFTGPAEFTLAGAPNACTAAIISGTYNKGSVLGSTNTVVIKANVTATGAYSVSTNTVNGVHFSAGGSFTATGQQDIILTGTGIPEAAGTFSFTPQLGNGACSFDVTVGETPVDAGVFTCKIDNVSMAFNDRAKASIETVLTPNTLILEGFTGPPNGANVPELQIFINNNNGSPVKAGTYNVDGYLVPGYNIEIDYAEVLADGSVVRWNTSSSLFSANPPFEIKITSISATRVKGTFSGEITNIFQNSTKRKKVTEGTFDLPIQ